jgi:anti-sigma regulatory factor (Ser/Thr protein kinase)
MLREEGQFPARFEHIEAICDLVERAAKVAEFDDHAQYACQLAIGEACENIICHGYKEIEDGRILVKVQASPGELTVELEDNAPPFDPSKKVKNDCCAEDLEGGLGLPILHKVMDEIEYSRYGDTNHLILRKHSSSD